MFKKSENCIDYVILHEIIHLVEPKHNKNFVRLLDKYLPKWLQFKQELNDGMLPHTNWEL
jgi:predicted metal-dependent hydrolase